MPTKLYEREEWIYPKYKTDLFLIGECIKKMERGYSPIILICGKQRSGKSFIALWVAYRILKFYKKKLEPKNNVFFDPLKAMEDLENAEKEPFIIDEAGALLGAREWWSKFNIAFDKVIQTQAYKCNCYIFVLPFATDLDKIFRKHVDFQILMRKRGYFSVFEFIKKYGEMKKDSRAYKRILKENIVVRKKLLPEELWKEYEGMVMGLKEVIRQREVDKIHTLKTKETWQPFNRR